MTIYRFNLQTANYSVFRETYNESFRKKFIPKNSSIVKSNDDYNINFSFMFYGNDTPAFKDHALDGIRSVYVLECWKGEKIGNEKKYNFWEPLVSTVSFISICCFILSILICIYEISISYVWLWTISAIISLATPLLLKNYMASMDDDTTPLSSSEIFIMAKKSCPQYFIANYSRNLLSHLPKKSNTQTTNNQNSLSKQQTIPLLSPPSKFLSVEDEEKVKNERMNARYRDKIEEESKNFIKNNPDVDLREYDRAIKEFAKLKIKNSIEDIRNIIQGTPEQAEKALDDLEIKEQKRVANHILYEGRMSSSFVKRVKEKLGYNCAACEKNLSDVYGEYGRKYIELHHKLPYADIKENTARMTAIEDLCVLCPDCHRMIHRLEYAGDIPLLRKIIELNKKRK